LKEELAESKREHKKQLDASNAASGELLVKHLALERKYNNLEGAINLKNEEVHSLKMEVQKSKESINAIQEVSRTKEELNQTLKEKLAESKRGHNEQVCAYDELFTNHSLLDSTCNSLGGAIKLNVEEVQSLKMEAQTAKESNNALTEASQCLGRSNQTKEEQNHILKEELAESKREHKKQLDASNAASGELLVKHLALERKYNNLEGAINLKNEEVHSLKMEVQKSKESINAIQEVSRTKEELNQTLKEKLAESKRGHNEQLGAYAELLTKHSVLESARNNLGGAIKLTNEEVQSSKTEVQTAKESTNVLTEANQSLERSNQMKEEQIHTLKVELEESKRGHNGQLGASKVAYNELLAMHTTLESEFSNLESAAKLKHEEVQSLKMEAQTAKESINALQEVSQTKEEQIHTLEEELAECKRGHKKYLDVFKAAYDELLTKHSSLETWRDDNLPCKRCNSPKPPIGERVKGAKTLSRSKSTPPSPRRSSRMKPTVRY